MDLRQYSDSIQQTLLYFFINSEHEPEELVTHNASFTAYYITEMAKRWAERRYHQKRTGKEMAIEEAVEKSLEATKKFFRSQERKAAPAQLANTMADAEDLFAFLEEKPKVKEEPPEEDSPASGEAEAEKTNGEVPEPREELPEPVAAHEPSVIATSSGPQEYPVITPEELKKIRRG